MKTRKTYKIAGMHCVGCVMLIEGELDDIGVKARINYAQQFIEAEFDPQKTTSDQIKKTIAKLGYTVVE